MENVIRIENLTKTYRKKRGVENVSFEVGEGEIFGFIGPNGAGKSTTIRSMLRFLKFNSGKIEILGKDSVKDYEKILKEVGYMPSEALFIFDEPTSGLDPLMQNIFFELINEYVAQGTTCMLSTHVLPEVSRYCDRAAVMREGHLIKTDTPVNICIPFLYREERQ
ncbi:MAG: ATP-binding cassette domain-containing protein [Butyrivibrio sp.]|nr:ATP-binding cassette domain-containing protein [Butyrivibrio sp.]MBP3198504.1 ATP-binding cassette domain-containing protein [Butyrivibrio sp.]